MRVKSLAYKNQMGKKKSTNVSTSWVPSEFGQTDLTKAQKDGFIAKGDQVIFPSTKRIPKPSSGYRVMFLAFLLCGLSLPAHEFLRGLLFVYSVQLHQLTPNLILHISCLCESFLGVDPHWTLWRFLFRLHPSVSLSKNPELGGAIVSVRTKAHYLEFSMAASVQGWRKKWFYIKDRKVASSDQYGVAPFDAFLYFVNFSFIHLLVFCRCFAKSFLTYSSAGSPILCFSPSSSRGRTYSG
jgi:hypothetical protein